MSGATALYPPAHKTRRWPLYGRIAPTGNLHKPTLPAWLTRPVESGAGKRQVVAILDNKVYLGHMAGLRTTSLPYKKLIRKPENEQVLVEDTHEPLITQELWDIAQSVRQHKKRIPKHMDELNLFSGVATVPTAPSPWYCIVQAP